MGHKTYKNRKDAFTFINEIWVPINKLVHPYLLEYYYVSNYGRIYSKAKEKFLDGGIDFDGYRIVTLHVKDGYGTCGEKLNQITRRINRIVLLSFVPIQDSEKYIAHHINHYRLDNRLENLMWVSPAENAQFSFKVGYRRFIDIAGENNPCSKLTNNQVIEIKNKLMSGNFGFAQLAREYGVADSVIAGIAHNKTWTKIGPIVPYESLKISEALTNDEFLNICQWLESHNDIINDKSIFPSMNKLLQKIYSDVGLESKYGDMENKRKVLIGILRKSIHRYDYITSKFNYNYMY